MRVVFNMYSVKIEHLPCCFLLDLSIRPRLPVFAIKAKPPVSMILPPSKLIKSGDAAVGWPQTGFNFKHAELATA